MNFYQILNINSNTDSEDIKKAIIKAKRLWMRRLNAPTLDRRQNAEKTLEKIEEAEKILLDPKLRKEYDKNLKSQTESIPTQQEVLDSENSLALIIQNLENDQIGQAIFLGNQLIKQEPDNHPAWALLGRCHACFGNTSEAISAYNEAINLRADEDPYYFDRATIYEQSELYQEALKDYERAYKISKKAVYKASMAFVLAKLDELDQAIVLLEECVKQEPENIPYQDNLALGYMDKARHSWIFVRKDEHDKLSEGFYPISKEQVLEARRWLDKANGFPLTSPEIKEEIKRHQRAVDKMLERRFDGSFKAVLAYIFIGLFFTEPISKTLLFILVAFLYWVACRSPQYLVNKRLLKNEASSEESIISAAKSEDDDTSTRLISVAMNFGLMLFLLPLIAIGKAMKNYL